MDAPLRTNQPCIVVARTDQLQKLVEEAIDTYGPNVDLNHLDVSRIENFSMLFAHSKFNGDVSRWNMQNAINCTEMFASSPFNGDLSHWNTSKMTLAGAMFQSCAFNGDLSRWSMARLVSADRMFQNSAFTGEHGGVKNWRLPLLIEGQSMFHRSPFNGDVSQWGVGSLTTASHMFDTPTFQGDLTLWGGNEDLAERFQLDSMLHRKFNGTLPRLRGDNVVDKYTAMMGGHEHLHAYAARTSFSYVHAILLMDASQDCGWASQEMVRWAHEHTQVGRAVGLDNDALARLMVEQHHHHENTDSPRIFNHAFSALS